MTCLQRIDNFFDRSLVLLGPFGRLLLLNGLLLEIGLDDVLVEHESSVSDACSGDNAAIMIANCGTRRLPT